MLFGTLRNSNRFFKDSGNGFQSFQFGELTFIVNDFGRGSRGLFETNSDRFTFTSETPYLRTNSGYKKVEKAQENLSEIVPKSENNFAAFELKKTVSGWSAFASSARITRARMYFLFVEGGILWSDDLRELIPFSSREMNPTGAFPF